MSGTWGSEWDGSKVKMSLALSPMVYKIIAGVKDFFLFTRLPLLFGWLQHPIKFLSNFIGLSKWIRKHGATARFNDFYRGARSYDDREKLYQHLADSEHILDIPIHYLEFGVYSGNSFQWWLTRNTDENSRFWGFDTFEGLPEKWLFMNKGALSSDTPQISDPRGQFIKGLFQETLISFLQATFKYNDPSAVRKVIHMDADLFSSTLFVLTSLAPYLQQGDLIIFDEFNVPNHEYAAWELFTSTYYVDFELLGAVNNYYQIAVKYKGMAVFQ